MSSRARKMTPRSNQKQQLESDKSNGEQQAATATTTTSSSPFLINQDGEFLQYKSSSSSANINSQLPAFGRGSGGGGASMMMMPQNNKKRTPVEGLSDSDDDTPLARTGGAAADSSSASSAAGGGAGGFASSNKINKPPAQQRQLSKFEQKRMLEASLRQKDNIMQSQVVRGVEFKGSAFKPSVSVVRFDDFKMASSSKGEEKEKTYTTTVTFTNTSLAAASMRPDAVPREHADCLIVRFVPCGMVSPGMSTQATITFVPKEMVDIDTQLSFTTSTGKLLLPVMCRTPKLAVSVSTRRINFDVVPVGTAADKHITVRNSGSLSTLFSVQGEIISELKTLKHPTLSEMIAERRAKVIKESELPLAVDGAAATPSKQQKQQEDGKEGSNKNQDEKTLDGGESNTVVAAAPATSSSSLDATQLPKTATTPQPRSSNTPRGQRGGAGRSPIATPRSARQNASTTQPPAAAAASASTSAPADDDNSKEPQQQTKSDPEEEATTTTVVEQQQESNKRKCSHNVLTLVETDTCDATIIDDILHGEPITLNANSAVTIAFRFHPHESMGDGGFKSSFFIAFDAEDIDDVPVLVTGATSDLPVSIESPTDVVKMHCGYYGITYRSEITIRNRKQTSVRVSPKVPQVWRDHIIFTPATAVAQPNEPFTFRVKLTVPADELFVAKASSTSSNKNISNNHNHNHLSVLFHILFELADESLPLILFVSGMFCKNTLNVTPHEFSFGTMNENEFSSRRVSIHNPGLLPRHVCVHDFPHNVTVSPRSAVSAAIQKKRSKQLALEPVLTRHACNMTIMPNETYEFDVAMRPPDAPAPGITPPAEWTDTVTLRCDDDARIPIHISGSRRRPPLEFSAPSVLLPRCAVWDVVSVSVVLRNKSNSARSFSFAPLHPKLGIRVSPVSGEIERNGSVVVVVEFHAHGSIIESLPMLEPDSTPTAAELALAQSMSPMSEATLAATSSKKLSSTSNKKRSKAEDEQIARDVAAAEDARKRLANYCEHVCEVTKKELREVAPWEQLEDDAQRITTFEVASGDPAVELFYANQQQQQGNNNSSSNTIVNQSQLPLPAGCTASLFETNKGNAVAGCFTRTVTVPCHIQGWNQGAAWIGLAVRCSVIPPVVVAESHTTAELLEAKSAQQVKDFQLQRQQQLEMEAAAASPSSHHHHHGNKPRTPRGGPPSTAEASSASSAVAVAASHQSSSSSSSLSALAGKFKDSHVLILFPPTASITGRSTNSVKLALSSVLRGGGIVSSSSMSPSSSGAAGADLMLEASLGNLGDTLMSMISGGQQQRAISVSPTPGSSALLTNTKSMVVVPENHKHRKIFITVSPLDPHGPFQLLVPPRTELDLPDTLTTECTFAFRPKYSANYRVEGQIIISCPETGVVHNIRLRLEGEGLPTSFVVSCDKNALLAEAAAAGAATGAGSGAGDRPRSGRGSRPSDPLANSMKSGGGGGSPKSGSGGGGSGANNSNNALSSDDASRFAMAVDSPRDVPALRLSLGHVLVGSAKAQETVYILNRSSFPVTCKFQVVPHRTCPSIDAGGVLPFSVEPHALHLAPYAVGEASVWCATLTAGTFLSAIRVTTSQDRSASDGGGGGGEGSGSDNNNNNKSATTGGDNGNNNLIESESELLVSCCVWDYPTFALLPDTTDAPLPVSSFSSLLPGGSGGVGGASGAGKQKPSSASSPVRGGSGSGSSSEAPSSSRNQVQPLWLLPPKFESRLRELALAPGLELSVVSRKQKVQARSRVEAVQALRFATAATLNPLLSGGGASAVPLVSAAIQFGGAQPGTQAPSSSPSPAVAASSTTASSSAGGGIAIPSSSPLLSSPALSAALAAFTSPSAQQQAATSLAPLNAYNPYGRDLYFGPTAQPGSCPEFPLILNFVTSMDSAAAQQLLQSARGGAGGDEKEKDKGGGGGGGSGGNNNLSAQTSTIVSSVLAAEKNALTSGGGGGSGGGSGSTAASRKVHLNTAGSAAAMSQPVAPGVAHQIVLGYVRQQGTTIPNSNANGEFVVDSAIQDPVAMKQGWRADPPRGVLSPSQPLQRLVLSFSPTAALVNALPVPGVTVSSSIDVKLSIKFGNAEPQVVYLRLVGQVKRG